MPYTPTVWASGDTITAAKLTNIETQLDRLTDLGESAMGIKSAFTPPADLPAIARLLHYPSAFTYGSTPLASNGYFRIGDSASWRTTTPIGFQQSIAAVSTNSTTEALHINNLYIFPDHGALTFTKVQGLVRVYLKGDSSNTAQWTRLDFEVCKVSAAGVETVLNTNTQSDLTLSSQGGIATQPVNIDYGAGFALAAGERLAFRIKVYGKASSATYNSYFYPNGLGPQDDGSISLFALTFA